MLGVSLCDYQNTKTLALLISHIVSVVTKQMQVTERA
jgi:hypothetical protein